jgi:polyhydroxybutyrate depolymerase
MALYQCTFEATGGKSLRVRISNAVHCAKMLAVTVLALSSINCRRVSAPAPSEEVAVAVESPVIIGGTRPVRAFRPATGTAPAPLILVLHGYGADGPSQLGWFGLDRIAEAHVVAPDGTLDGTGRRFWNAVDTCCDFEARDVDDVGYLLSLVDNVAAHHAVDRARVYAVGISNGGAMALRLACDASDRIAAVVSFAAPWSDKFSCAPKHKIGIRVMHGTRDSVVPFEGGAIIPGLHPNARGSLPSARSIAERFARSHGCSGPLSIGDTLDLDRTVTGAETTTAQFTGCPSGAEVEMWTLVGSMHVPPPLTERFVTETWRFLSAHRNPT